MERQIKFRGLGYDKKFHFGYYFRIGDFHYIQTMIESISINPLTICQFTGLKDKNGVDIYEGDIVKLSDIIIPITWWDGGFQMISNENQGKSSAIQDRLKRFEVIGNIYENPNLLQDGNK